MTAGDPEAQLRVELLHGGEFLRAAMALLKLSIGRFAGRGVGTTRNRCQQGDGDPVVLFC